MKAKDAENAQVVFGLTGGIACGKSTVASLMQAQGAVVIDADEISREVVQPGSDGLAAVVSRFGPKILHQDGSLDRKALGALVFGDPDARTALEAILHPRIAIRAAERIAAALNGPDRPILYDAALLFETGSAAHFAGVVVVAAPRDLQRSRLMARDGISGEEADERIDAQMPVEDKVALADWVIHNHGSLEELSESVNALLPQLLQRS